MKKSVMIGIALVFAFVAVFIIMETEDSDAAINNDCGNAYVKGVKYDLCTNNDPNDPNYGNIQYMAFVSGGAANVYNPNYSLPVLEIVPQIEKDGKTFVVVGIRNNAFQASKATDESGGCGKHLEKVIIPETLQYIGVGSNYKPAGPYEQPSCFSGCQKLTDLVLDGEHPQLKQIGANSFNGTSIRVLDLSHCTELTSVMFNAFNMSNIEVVDIRHVKSIGNNAFSGLKDKLIEIVMPMDLDATIHSNAFPGMTFKDEGGNPITGNALVGKCFKKIDGEMKQGHVATFDSNGGTRHDEDVYLVGEELPKISREGFTFYKWKDIATGNLYSTMPSVNVDFIAVWMLEKPTSVSVTYNGYEQTVYHDTHAYTVSGSSHKNVGSYEATFTLKEDANIIWADETSDPVIVSWNITKKLLTATYHGENVKPGATPLLKVEVTGFVGGDTPQTAAGYVSPFISDKDLPTDMGKYTLTPIGGAADNYEFEYKSGTLHNNFGLEESEYVFVGTVALVVLMSLYMLFTHTLAGKKY